MTSKIEATEDMNSVMYTITILQQHNMHLIDSSKSSSTLGSSSSGRSSTLGSTSTRRQTQLLQLESLAEDSINKLEVFTHNCLMIAKLKTTYRRLHAVQTLKVKAAAAAKAKMDAEDDKAFGELCDAVEPKWPISDMDFSQWKVL